MNSRLSHLVTTVSVICFLTGCDSSVRPTSDDIAVHVDENPEPSIGYDLVSTAADGSRTIEYQLTQYATETRTREVSVQKSRLEDRTRHLTNDDGTVRDEAYQIAVPYTEMVTEQYEVQVPLRVVRTAVIPAVESIASFLKAEGAVDFER